MIRVYIGLGSNLNDPQAQLKQAIISIKKIPLSKVIKCSSFYLSKPFGNIEQPDYINAVLEFATELSPHDLLDFLQGIEAKQQRVRQQRWGPRTLDLDILMYDDNIIKDSRLSIPHVEMHRRGFVLLPLYEIAPDGEVAGLGGIHDLLQKVDVRDVRKIEQHVSRNSPS